MTFGFTSLCDYSTSVSSGGVDKTETSKTEKLNFNGSIITFNDFTILIDPGWISQKNAGYDSDQGTDNGNNAISTDPKQDVYQTQDIYQSLIEFWTPIMQKVDLILLSQSSIDCLGSYAFIFTHFQSILYNNNVKVYSTLPVANLGRVSTIDLYCSLQMTGPFTTSQLEIEDIENAFDYIVTLKYSQMINVQEYTNDKLFFTAYSSGHSIGGCSYCIENSEEKLIYSPKWSHTKDILVKGTQMLNQEGNLSPIKSLMKPSCFITSMKYTTLGQPLPLRKKFADFKKYCKDTLKGNNCILIPTSIGMDFLNIFVLLHDYFNDLRTGRSGNQRGSQQQQQQQPSVYLVSYSKGRSLTYAKSMLEWLSNDIVKQWQARDNKTPFDLDLKVLSPLDFQKKKNDIILKGGIIFVSDDELLFNQVLTAFISNNQMLKNCHVLMTTAFTNSPLIQDMLKTSDDDIEYNKVVELKDYQIEPLSDEEYVTYKEVIRERNSKRQALKYEYESIQETNRKQNLNSLLEEDSEEDEDDDEDSDEENEDRNTENGKDNALNSKDKKFLETLNGSNKETYGEDGELKIPMDIIIKENAPIKQKMFPYRFSKNVVKDDYGLLVDFSQFVPIDETEDDYVLDLKRTRRGSKTNGGSGEDDSGEDDDNQEDQEDDDDYDPTKTISKPRGNKKRATEKEKELQNFDDISYLEPLDSKPTKAHLVNQKYKLACKIEYIDMTSYIDQRSMDIILPSFQPGRLLLVDSLATEKTYPNIETITINDNNQHIFSSSIKILDIAISPELEKQIHWQSVLNGKYKITNVSGRLVKLLDKPAEQDKTKMGNSTLGTKVKLELKPLGEKKTAFSDQEHDYNNLHLGDIKLNQLKELLVQMNHQAQFKGDGTLVVDNVVFIKKISDSVTVIDGKPSKLFYTVKKVVTSTLATI
ncbi:hypothetical protein ACO0QE_002741 [Hanseniaspora vineae]